MNVVKATRKTQIFRAIRMIQFIAVNIGNMWILLSSKPVTAIFRLRYADFEFMHVCSFSHHRVTIPPVNWINACHRNGVKTLGTFIVEGTAGMFALERFVYGPEPGQRNSWSPYYADKLGTMGEQLGSPQHNLAELFPFLQWT